MKLCFINNCRDESEEFWEKAFLCMADRGIDTVVVRMKLHEFIWTKQRSKYPQMRLFLLTHIPQGMEKKPVRLARRMAGCLTLDRAVCMIEKRYGKTGLGQMFSAYGRAKQRMGEIEMIQI